jgi:hypothetical protein
MGSPKFSSARRGSAYMLKAGFIPPTTHNNHEPFVQMAQMLKQDYEWHSDLSAHVATLSKVEESRQEADMEFTKLNSQLGNINNVVASMKTIREDYSPKVLDNNLERVNSRQIARLFSVSRGKDIEANSQAFPLPPSRGATLSRDASDLRGAGREVPTSGGDGPPIDIEVKPTNRYPLRQRASAVSFAAKMVRQRKTKIAALEKMEVDKLAKEQADLEELKQKRRTMTLAEWKKMREARQKDKEEKHLPIPLVSPYKPAPGNLNKRNPFEENSPSKLRAQTFDNSIFPAFKLKPLVMEKQLGSPKPSPKKELAKSLNAVSAVVKIETKHHKKRGGMRVGHSSPKFAPPSLEERIKVEKEKRELEREERYERAKAARSPLSHSLSSPSNAGRDGTFSSDESSGDESEANDPATQPNLLEVFRPLSATTSQFILSSKNYDSYSMKRDQENEPKTPRRIYIQQCLKEETFPEPIITRTTKGVKLDGGISMKNYGMGDRQLKALSAAINVMSIKHLDLSGNRIVSSEAALSIVKKLDPHVLQKLDMSRNRLSVPAINLICNILAESTCMVSLGLEEANVRQNTLSSLCSAIAFRDVCSSSGVLKHECPLRELNLARNNIGDSGAASIASMLKKSKHLTMLDLSWNNIRRAGAVAIFKSIDGASVIASLDLGYNAIGSTLDRERDAVHALAKCLNPTTGATAGCSLTHLNVSHNQMCEEDCRILSKALAVNHTLLGIHVEGNSGFIDSKGFLVPGADMYPNGNGGTLFSRILSHEGQATNNLRANPDKENWACRSNCWICEKWQEFVFVWDPVKSQTPKPEVAASSYDVWLATSYDHWVGQKMSFCEETSDYRSICMVPPGSNQYAFVVKQLDSGKDSPSRAPALSGSRPGSRTSTPKQTPTHTPSATPRRRTSSADEGKLKAKEQDETLKLIKENKLLLKTLEAELRAVMSEAPSIGQLNDVQLLAKLALEKQIEPINRLLLVLNPPAPPIVPTIALDQPTSKLAPTFGAISEHSVKNLPYTVNQVVISLPKTFDADKSLPPRSKEVVMKVQGKWKFEDSVWRDFQQDTEELLNDAFEQDYSMTKIEKNIAKKGKNDDEVFDEQETKALLRKNYVAIKQIFRNYAAGIGSGNEIFSMGKNAYYNFLETCLIMDGDNVKKGLGRAEVALIFVVCQSIGPKASFNKKNALCRFQFMDAIVSMAITKYFESGTCSTKCEAVAKLLDDHILDKSDAVGLDGYKKDTIYNEEIDMIIKKNLVYLEQVYKAYSGKFNLPHEKEKTISYLEWTDLLYDSMLVSDGFVDRNIRVIYVRSQQTVVNELADKSGRSMNFVEYIHGLCWVAASMENGGSGTGTPRLGPAIQKLVNRLMQNLKLDQRKKGPG